MNYTLTRALVAILLLAVWTQTTESTTTTYSKEYILSLAKRQQQLPADFMNPGLPGAYCVNKSQLNMSFPCQSFLVYDMVYVDHYQELRDIYAAGILGSLPNEECRLISARYLCPTYYRECLQFEAPHDDAPPNPTESNVTVVGRYVCEDLCWKQVEPCRSAVPPELASTYLNCSIANPDLFGPTDIDIFPNGTGVYEATAPNGVTFSYEIQCYDESKDITFSTPVACPAGTYNLEPGVCAFECPEPLIEKDEFDGITTMMSVMGWISFVLMAFLSATYLLDPEKRKFPNYLPVFFFIAIMCFSFAFCLASTLPDGHRDMICENDQEANYFGAGACTVQGLLIVYFFLVAVLWWLVICFNIFLMFVLAAKNVDIRRINLGRHLSICYHCFAWLVPLIPIIIALSAERLGANGSDLWCTIHSSTEDNRLVLEIGEGLSGVRTSGVTDNAWNFGLFWAPVILCIVIGISLIFFVMFSQLRQDAGFQGFVKLLRSQWRVFAFLMLYVWVCVFLFAFQLDFEVKRNEQYDEYVTYTACLFQRNAALGVD
ncbi:Frizzled-10, partial [Balamuthia mandrillaris]